MRIAKTFAKRITKKIAKRFAKTIAKKIARKRCERIDLSQALKLVLSALPTFSIII